MGGVEGCFLAVKAQGETITRIRFRTTIKRIRTVDTRTPRTIRISTGEDLSNTLSLIRKREYRNPQSLRLFLPAYCLVFGVNNVI